MLPGIAWPFGMPRGRRLDCWIHRSESSKHRPIPARLPGFVPRSMRRRQLTAPP
jgi:hypothetical protein